MFNFIIQILIQAIIMVPFYSLLFYLFLKIVKVNEQLWKRAFMLGAVAHAAIVVCSLVLRFIPVPYLNLGVAVMLIAYFLTRVLIIDAGKAVLAAFLVVVLGQLMAGFFITAVLKAMVSSTSL
jgi:hypothetical protein